MHHHGLLGILLLFLVGSGTVMPSNCSKQDPVQTLAQIEQALAQGNIDGGVALYAQVRAYTMQASANMPEFAQGWVQALVYTLDHGADPATTAKIVAILNDLGTSPKSQYVISGWLQSPQGQTTLGLLNPTLRQQLLDSQTFRFPQ